MKIGRRPLVKTIKLYNVDGTENKQGEMTHRCQLRIKYNGKEDLQDFYITNLGKDRIILGYPFLERFNPKIDWSEGRLTEGPVVIQTAMFKHLDRMVTNWQDKDKSHLCQTTYAVTKNDRGISEGKAQRRCCHSDRIQEVYKGLLRGRGKKVPSGPKPQRSHQAIARSARTIKLQSIPAHKRRNADTEEVSGRRTGEGVHC